jgi:sugar O-acyltransferase (sialic acid O-acetyltransferase NeuD family)
VAEDLVIVGAGGFGRETVDVVDAVNAAAGDPVWRLLGVIDDAPSPENLERLARRVIPYVGTTDDLLSSGIKPRFLIGIGSPAVRRMLADRLEDAGLVAATVIHPAATMGSDVSVGAGTVICAGARVTTNISIGRHVHLNPNVTVGHDTTLGDFVSMNPASSVSGDCVVETGALIGVGAVVLNLLTVGEDATVGASACVARNVLPGSVVKGVPAR